MIGFFPPLYPDELLYSQLARYYIKSGYLSYIHAAEDLFQQRTTRPNMEFITALNPTTLEIVTKDKPIETIIQKHTMFPYYGHFLPKERRTKAFQALVSMQGSYHNLLPIPKRRNNIDRYLRYCPLCAEQDRNAYGETYWHRIHQLIGMTVCPIHGCYLMNSNVVTNSKAPPMLKTAEESIPSSGEIHSPDNDIELQIAKYMTEVFQMDVALDSDVSVGQFLHSKMQHTPYCSTRGEQRNMRLLYADFMRYYKSLPDSWFTEMWQIEKVLTDDRTNFYEICLLALFLNIPASELVNRTLPEKSKQQFFDEEIHRLHNQGLKYPEIAKRLNASYDVVKSIGEGRYGMTTSPSKFPHQNGVKSENLDQIDEDTLPLILPAIQKLHGDGQSRPRRITIAAIEKTLGFYKGRISRYLPKCKAEILKYTESQEQYWARKVVCAIKQIIKSGSTPSWSKIHQMTNMRKKDFESCIPYISDYAEGQLLGQILSLLE